jgi:hypothetical protein
VASFHATLEETLNADLLMHVVDASHPRAAEQMAAVESVLSSLSFHTRCDIVVLNKIDRVEDPIGLQKLVRDEACDVVYVSAHTGAGLDRLDEAVKKRLDARSFLVDVHMSVADGRLDAAVRRLGQPVEDEIDAQSGLHRLRARLTAGALGNLRRAASPDVRFDVIRPPADGGLGRDRPEPGSEHDLQPGRTPDREPPAAPDVEARAEPGAKADFEPASPAAIEDGALRDRRRRAE